mmetsp:Transcript_8267/g.18470  ORF Transcript_8267/g.18470 Transcript_8267/m.18470 type:complete len:114 (-) Transcript_8267:141-482(-)
MASVHVPFFLDGHLTASFRGMQCVDGSITLGRAKGAKPAKLVPPGSERLDHSQLLRICSSDNVEMCARYKGPADFLRMTSPEGVQEMMAWGVRHVDDMDAKGQLRGLEEVRRA